MIWKVFLIVHILSGSIALISGGLASLLKKGGRGHILSGRFFVYSMMLTGVSALVLSNIKPNPFLTSVGCFSLYMTIAGWIWIRRIKLTQKIRIIRVWAIFGLAASAYLFVVGLWDGIYPVPLVFGAILVLMSLTDAFGEHTGNVVVRRHISRIGGAYIATVTAFLVVNIHFLPGLVVWLTQR